jgi:hypothetical protein
VGGAQLVRKDEHPAPRFLHNRSCSHILPEYGRELRRWSNTIANHSLR